MGQIQRLYSGIYECGECAARYQIIEVPGAELTCDCGGDLEELDSDLESDETN
jgi:hypothetical protein